MRFIQSVVIPLLVAGAAAKSTNLRLRDVGVNATEIAAPMDVNGINGVETAEAAEGVEAADATDATDAAEIAEAGVRLT
jgi:hypothetical protein